MRLYDAMLRYYLKVDPNKLDDLEWATQIMDLHFIRTEEAKQSKVKQ